MARRLQRKTSAPKLTHEDYAALIRERFAYAPRAADEFTAAEFALLTGCSNESARRKLLALVEAGAWQRRPYNGRYLYREVTS